VFSELGSCRGVVRGCGGGCGPHRAALARGGIWAIIVLEIHVTIQIVISYVFVCNKNKALQLQRVPILSILGYYNIGSLAASDSTLLVLRQFCVGAESVLFLGSTTSHKT